MLTKFSVKNYKQFKDEITFDLTAGNYSFNEECVKDKTVKTALIYGANGTGKSNLGWAVFDLVGHLITSTNPIEEGFLDYTYLNADSDNVLAEFTYEFKFLGKKVIYKYAKGADRKLHSELLTVSEDIQNHDTTLLRYELNKTFEINGLVGTEHLERHVPPYQNLSILRYIYSNTVLSEANSYNKIFLELMKFVSRMLILRNVSDSQNYHLYSKDIEESIIANENLEDFEYFLKNNGVDCNLEAVGTLTHREIAFKFRNRSLPFSLIASTGTKELAVFYFWWQIVRNNENSLILIDEFDSSYHFKLSSNIVKKLKELPSTQVILTTHNTNLLNNDLIRPDCGYIIDGKRIKALQYCTKRELRHAHNLEKMYKAGAFNV